MAAKDNKDDVFSFDDFLKVLQQQQGGRMPASNACLTTPR